MYTCLVTIETKIPVHIIKQIELKLKNQINCQCFNINTSFYNVLIHVL